MALAMTRRRLLIAVATGAVAAVGPAVLGWRAMIDGGGATEQFQISREEMNSFVGAVVLEVTDSERFTARTPYGTADIYVPGDAQEIWAGALGPYLPAGGDTFDAAGSWDGEPGDSLFTADRIYFNLEHIRGEVVTDAVTSGTAVSFAVESAADESRWEVDVEASTLTSATIPFDEAAPEGMEAVERARSGWHIDMIGFRRGDGTLLVTWIELYSPEPAGGG